MDKQMNNQENIYETQTESNNTNQASTDSFDPASKQTAYDENFTRKDIEDIIEERMHQHTARYPNDIPGYFPLLIQGIIQALHMLCCCNIATTACGILTIYFIISANNEYKKNPNRGASELRTAKVLCIAGWITLLITVILNLANIGLNFFTIPSFNWNINFPNIETMQNIV